MELLDFGKGENVRSWRLDQFQARCDLQLCVHPLGSGTSSSYITIDAYGSDTANQAINAGTDSSTVADLLLQNQSYFGAPSDGRSFTRQVSGE